MNEETITLPSGLYYISDVDITQLKSGRWRVVASSVQAKGTRTPPITETVYAPTSCETAHNALCWASHSKAWQRLKIHSYGSKLLAKIREAFPDDGCRKELFSNLNKRINAEFMSGWLFRNSDAQDIIARIILKTPSAENIV